MRILHLADSVAPRDAVARAAYEAVLGDWNETQAVGAAAGIG